MNYQEFSSSRREISLRRPAGYRNTWRSLLPQWPHSAPCSAGGSQVLRGEHDRYQEPALRHRRIPEEPEVTEPGEALPSGNEEPAEEESPARSEEAAAEHWHPIGGQVDDETWLATQVG